MVNKEKKKDNLEENKNEKRSENGRKEEKEVKRSIKKIIKIGGSCFIDLASIKKVVSLIRNESEKSERVAVVVSALKGVTDLLLHAYHLACGQSRDFNGLITLLRQRHEHLAFELVCPSLIPQLQFKFESIFTSLSSCLQRIIIDREIRPDDRAKVLSMGERLSAHLLASILETEGIKARVYETDQIGLVATEEGGKFRVNLEKFDRNFARISEEILTSNFLPIFTGFFGSDEQGRVILFGRNSSDYSAAVIARGFKADRLELYKDVPGFLSCDPSLVSGVKLIPYLSREEASLLALYGARIIHPDFWEPLQGLKTEVLIKSFGLPDHPGTIITDEPSEEIENEDRKAISEKSGTIKGLALRDELIVLKLKIGWPKSSALQALTKLEKAIGERGGQILAFLPLINSSILIVGDISAESLTLIISSAAKREIDVLSVEKNLALLAAVGSAIKQKPSLLSLILQILIYEKITPRFLLSSPENSVLLILLPQDEARRALRKIHAEFFTGKSSGIRTVPGGHRLIT